MNDLICEFSCPSAGSLGLLSSLISRTTADMGVQQVSMRKLRQHTGRSEGLAYDPIPAHGPSWEALGRATLSYCVRWQLRESLGVLEHGVKYSLQDLVSNIHYFAERSRHLFTLFSPRSVPRESCLP